MTRPCVAALVAVLAVAGACEGTGGLSGGAPGRDAAPPFLPDGGFDAGAPDARASYRDVVMSDSPRAYYRLGEQSGPTAKDETGALPATYSGPPVFGVPGAIAGDPDTAVELDGVSDGLTPGPAFAFDGKSPYTLEIWVKPKALDDQYRMLFKHEDSIDAGREELGVWLRVDGTANERYVGGAAQAAVGPALQRDVYSHVVGTYDGAVLRLFVNAALVTSVTDTRTAAPKTTPFFIGSGGQVGYGVVSGSIDEAAVYDKALAPDRIRAHFDAAR